MTGRAGAGKTRLAIELMLRLVEREPGAWHAGFLKDGELRRFRQLQNLAAWRWGCPTLAVVDYAASVTEPLRLWLRELAENPARDNKAPLRLLLLEREASADAGWFASLVERTWSGEGVARLFDPPQPVPVRPLDSPWQRRAVLERMLAAASGFYGRPSPALPPPGDDPIFDRRLQEAIWQDPLYLIMEALVSQRAGLPETLSLSRTDLVFRVADHARRRWPRPRKPCAFAANWRRRARTPSCRTWPPR